jgi:hypothetical protein
VRLWAEAFAADPGLGDDRQAPFRYNAARAAVDADDADRAKLRAQVLGWLQAELAAWSKVLEGDPKASATVGPTLLHWQAAADLAGVRDRDALDRLPEGERDRWRDLWNDVVGLPKKASTTQSFVRRGAYTLVRRAGRICLNQQPPRAPSLAPKC